MKFNALWIVVVLVGCGGTTSPPRAVAGDNETKQAKEFAFEGIGFSTTLEEFKKQKPDASETSDDKDKAIGVSIFTTTHSEHATMAAFSFLGSKLSKIVIAYSRQNVHYLGGDKVLVEKMVEKFGKADADSKVSDEPYQVNLFWNIKDASKHIEFNANDKVTTISVEDTDLTKQIYEKKKKTAQPGF